MPAIIVGKCPANSYSVLYLLGARSEGARREGEWIVWPGTIFGKEIGSVKSISLLDRNIKIPVVFQSKDEAELTFDLTAPYVPDPEVRDKKTGIDRFSSLIFRSGDNGEIKDCEAEVIPPQFTAYVQAKVSAACGQIVAEELLHKQAPLGAYLNSILRLAIAPHLSHNPAICELGTSCEFPNQVPAERIVEFYEAHWKSVKAQLDEEDKKPDARSSAEQRWGIDIKPISVSQPRFTPDTQKAREEKLKVQERAKAMGTAFKHIKNAQKPITERNGLGLSPNEAVAFVQERLDPSIKKAHFTILGNATNATNVIRPDEFFGAEESSREEKGKSGKGRK